ncbi:retrovirus-related pol polyprotein from transposon TNT 1-94 [Tanacetum coccineum]
MALEAAKFVQDFKSLAKEADESLAKHKALELEIERLSRAVVSQDIMSVVQNPNVVETSDLQTELERTKERFENCIIKKENEYSKLWNDWYKKCEECKYDKISYDKAYNDMQQKIERLQAQLGDLKGKSKDTSSVSNTLDPLSQKLENENVELDFLSLLIRNAKSEVVCAMCTQCLIYANHDVCVLNYVNAMNSHGKEQKANVSNIENQKKQKPKVMRPKKVGSNERLASPKPSKPRSCLSTSNPIGTIIKRFFQIPHLFLAGYPNCFMVRRLGLFQAYDRESKASHQFILEVWELFEFGNASCLLAIMGFGDLQWGNILITRVFFVEGLGHNLFSVAHFCDSDLEVAFRRNTCFVKNLEGVDLLKGNRTTKLYTINLHEMASSIPILHQGTSKDEAPKVIKTFLKRITVLLQSPVIIIRTDNGTKFKNQILKEYFDSVGISHQASSVRTPQQNGVVERRNQTLRLLLRATLKTVPSFTVDLTKHHTSSLTVENQISPFYMYSGLSVIPRMIEKKLEAWGKKVILLFNVYSADSCAYRVHNRRTKKIMETMNVIFDELSAMAFEQSISKPGLQGMASGQISSGLDLTYAPSTITIQQPIEAAPRTTPAAQAPLVRQTPTTSITITDTVPTPINSSSQATNIPITSQDVDELETQQQHA